MNIPPNIQVILTNFDPINPDIYKNTYIALKCLIENCYYTQLKITSSNLIGFCPLRDFCTVKLKTSRGTGHSTAFCKIALEYFNKTLFLSPSFNITQYNFNIMRNLINNDQNNYVNFSHYRISTPNFTKDYLFKTCDFTIQEFTNSLRGIDTEAIFVDVSSTTLSNQALEEIYDTLTPCMANYKEKFFVFVE